MLWECSENALRMLWEWWRLSEKFTNLTLRQMETDGHRMWLPELLLELKSLLIFVAICSPGDIWRGWRGHPGDTGEISQLGSSWDLRDLWLSLSVCGKPSHGPMESIWGPLIGQSVISKLCWVLTFQQQQILSVISSVYLRQSTKVQVRVDINSSINRQWTIGQLKVSIRGLCVFSDWEWCCAGERRLMMIICWNPEIPWLWDNC